MSSRNTKSGGGGGDELSSSEATTKEKNGPVSGTAIRLKKEVGLFEGVAIIMGVIMGSGIFISPKGVLQDAHSVGFTLVVWVLTGFLSMLGAVCYAELGTTFPHSGGDYAYIREAYGCFPSFLFLWDANIVFVPTTNAIMALTFSKYVFQPFFHGCEPNENAVRLLAAFSIIFLTWLNCHNVKATTKVQNVFLIAKIAGLLTVIIAGLAYIFSGHYEHFKDPWKGTQTNPGLIASSFYSGIFSYSGWNYLNFMTEELKRPYKNLPRAIYISLPLVTLIYVLANLGYLAVLTKEEMLYSDAIGVSFGNKVLGWFSWIMPIFVALSTFGSLSIHIMTSSRLLFVGSRNGHFPKALSLISIERYTPTPALVFLCLLSLLYLVTSDIIALIEYASFVESSFIMLCISGMLWMRYSRPDLPRPIKVPIIVPIIFIILCAFLVFLPIYVKPLEVGMGVLITVTAIPFYFLFVWWSPGPKIFTTISKIFTELVQKIFLSAQQDHHHHEDD